MPANIILLGTEEKHFYFVQSALNGYDYHFNFISIEKAEGAPKRFRGADLIILDTLGHPEKHFGQFYFLRSDPQLSAIPVLALVKDNPPRLRYRLIQMGIDDYLSIPFDKLDLQIRIKHLLRPGHPPAADPAGSPPPSSPGARESLQSISELFHKMSKSIFGVGKERFLDAVLERLRNLCNAHYALLFEVSKASDQLVLQIVRPQTGRSEMLRIPIPGIPILEKAVRLREPTVLNEIVSQNPFIKQLSDYGNLSVKSFIVFPIAIQSQTRSILCLLKSDSEKFSEFHYLLVQNFSHFIVHFYYLSHLRKEVKGQMDGQVWQFYFEFLDQVVNQLSFGILVIGQDQRIKYLNENTAQLLQVSPQKVLYKPITEILPQEAVDTILQSVDQSPEREARPELELPNARGQKISVGCAVHEFTDSLNGERGYIVSLKDITHSKEIQEEMRRVDRLASLGVMASGIAHEIRNPLAGIKAMVQTFEEELAADDPKHEYVERIIRLVNRLDELLRTLFSYAKPPKPNRLFYDLESGLNDVVSLLRQKFRESNIQLQRHIHPRLPRIYVDPGQIQQVLVNLMLNSIDAIKQNGEITISVQPYDPLLVSGEARRLPPLKQREVDTYVEMVIEDNGCGISPEVLKQIFNPFFTTKSFGTGLGLSIVYQIVKENNGAIYYDSEVGKGTTCYLYFPARSPQSPD